MTIRRYVKILIAAVALSCIAEITCILLAFSGERNAEPDIVAINDIVMSLQENNENITAE